MINHMLIETICFPDGEDEASCNFYEPKYNGEEELTICEYRRQNKYCCNDQAIMQACLSYCIDLFHNVNVELINSHSKIFSEKILNRQLKKELKQLKKEIINDNNDRTDKTND